MQSKRKHLEAIISITVRFKEDLNTQKEMVRMMKESTQHFQKQLKECVILLKN